MDRLICGDVGYGKTELAIRAAFKAVDNGKQVAVLVPTTVLAEQHHRTFSQRLAEFPFAVECLSRFRTAGEQKRILARLAEGGVDIIIGTHRLVSADVHFKDLGLVIIDEEQRFGVEHKERLKRLRRDVDVLTLTATPIPRTLHMSLLGIRDITNLETPPPDRLAIETRIVRFDQQLIRNAILRELNREGQVYFVHNRVHDIHEIADRMQKIVPEARMAVAHGQMAGDELEEAMLRFVRREADILVATTIIESGLDIPNANTIFINQADNYGLADLHQLRGRVGRYKHRAYAYLLLDADRQVTPTAARRLKAIEEFTELGAGFKIAMRDLEIRGAGQHPRHPAERPHRGGRLRAVLPAAGKRGARVEGPGPADAAGGDGRSAVDRLLAARLRGRAAAADRGLSPAGAGARPGPAGRLPPGAARPLRAAAGAGRVAAAAGGTAAAGDALAAGYGPPGEGGGGRGADGRGAGLPQCEADQGIGGAESVVGWSWWMRRAPTSGCGRRRRKPLAMYRTIKGLLRA